MKNIIPLLALVSLFFSACVSKEPIRVAEPMTTPAASVTPVKSPKMKIIQIPLIVKESRLFQDGSVDQYTITEWSQDLSRPLNKKTYDANKKKLMGSVVYEYVGDKEISETQYDGANGLKSKKLFEYDGSGRVISETSLDDRSKPQLKSTYEYDKDGNKVSWKVFDGAGVCYSNTIYSYTGKMIKSMEMRGLEDQFEGRVDIMWNDLGKEIGRTYYLADGSMDYQEKYLYTDGRRSAEEKRSPGGNLITTTVYEYADGSAPVKKLIKNAQNKLISGSVFEYINRQESVLDE